MIALHRDSVYTFFVNNEDNRRLDDSPIETDLLDESTKEKTGKRVRLGLAGISGECEMAFEPKNTNWEGTRKIGVVVNKKLYKNWTGAILQLRPNYGHIFIEHVLHPEEFAK